MGMRVGYARVSTVGQKLDVQMDHLGDCDRIFREKASASSTKNRPELKNGPITQTKAKSLEECRSHRLKFA